MANRQTSFKAIKAIAGAILLSLGLLLLIANLDEVAARVGNSSTSTTSSVGTVIDVGVAGLRTVQAYYFDQPTFQAGLHRILVSLWPLILVIIGATLLQNAVGRRLVNPKMDTNYSSMGARE
jgi:hypothetical protein